MVARINRRSFVAGAAAAAGAVTYPGIVRAEDRELVIVSYGGDLQKPHQWLAKQMEARHPGLKITLVPSEDQDIVAKIKAARDYSPFDAMPNGEPPHLTGIRDGYIMPVKPETMPNYKKVIPQFLAKNGGYGVPATYTLIGLAYHSDMVKTPPKSWLDLWKPEYRGMIGIPRPTSNLGLGFLALAAKLHGGSESNLEPVYAKLKELKPIVGRSPVQLTQLMERQEVGIAPMWNNSTATLAERGMPIRFVMPDPGPVAIISFMSEVTKSRHPDLVHEWMNGIISPEYQTLAAASPFFFGPTIEGIAIPDAAKPYTPSTPEQVLKLQSVDWKLVVPNQGAIIDRFDREVGT